MYKYLIVLVLLTPPAAKAETPNVFWSMNEGNATVVLPDIGDPDIFYLPITSGSRAVMGGISGDAMYLNKTWVLVAGGDFNTVKLLSGNCFVDPSQCQGGLALGMWISVKTTADQFCFFSIPRSCDETTSTGVALQKNGGVILATVNLPNGSYFQASVDSAFLLKHMWHHIGFIWDSNSGIKILINGTEVHTYVKRPSYTEDAPKSVVPAMVFGGFVGFLPSNMAVLYDDVKLWYTPISEVDFQIASEPHVAIHTTAATSTTTTTTAPTVIRSATTTHTTGLTRRLFPTASTTGIFTTRERDDITATISFISSANASPFSVTITTSLPSNTTAQFAGVNSTTARVESPSNSSSGVLRWLLVSLCLVLLLIIGLMLFILWKRRRRERNGEFLRVDSTTTAATSTNNSNYVSSRLGSSVLL